MGRHTLLTGKCGNSTLSPFLLASYSVQLKSFVIHLCSPSGEAKRMFLPSRKAILSAKALCNY